MSAWECFCGDTVLGDYCEWCAVRSRDRRIEVLTELLRKYGGHVEAECRTAHDGSPCSCGWSAALTEEVGEGLHDVYPSFPSG